MKKILSAVLLCSIATVCAAEEYQFLGGVGATKEDVDGADTVFNLGGVYYFSGQKTVGPLDQFAYIDDTSNVRAGILGTSDYKVNMIGGSYYFNRFAVGADYTDLDGDASILRIHGDFFILDNLKASIALNQIDSDYFDDIDDVWEANLQYDHSINETDYIGFTLSYEDADDAVIGLSTKYLNAFDNGQFLVVEAEFVDDVESSFGAAATWYLNKNTGFVVGGDDSDNLYVGARHFFNTNFALEAAIGQNSSSDDSYNFYNLTAILQL